MFVEGAAYGETLHAFFKQEHGYGLTRGGVAVGFGRDTVEVGMNAIGDKHFGPVQDIMVPLAAGKTSDAFDVRSGAGLCYADGDDFSPRDHVGHIGCALGLCACIVKVNRSHIRMNKRRDGKTGIG